MMFTRRRGSASPPSWLLLAGVAMLGVQLLITVANVATWDPDGNARDLVEVNAEANLPAWYSSALLLGQAAAAFALWLLPRRSRLGGRLWLLLAIGFAGLSLEEIAGLHERIGERLSVVDEVQDWPIVYLPILVAGTLILVKALGDLPRPRAMMVASGLACYVVVAGAEALSIVTLGSRGERLLEENAEMAGHALILLGLAWEVEARVRALVDGLRTGRTRQPPVADPPGEEADARSLASSAFRAP